MVVFHPNFAPVIPKHRKEPVSELYLAILSAFPVADMDDFEVTINITRFQVGRLRDPKTGIKNEGVEDAIPDLPQSRQNAPDFLVAQRQGQFPPATGVSDEGDHFWPAQGPSIQEGCGCKVDAAAVRAEVTPDQILFPGPDIVRRKEIRRLPVEFGQEPDGDRILFDRVLSAPSTLQVTNHAVS